LFNKESDSNDNNNNNNTNNNVSFEMYNLLKRMLVKKKYVMHTVRQENINASTRLRMKRLLNQQQQQQQQQVNTTSTPVANQSSSSPISISNPVTSTTTATNTTTTKTRPSTAVNLETFNDPTNQQINSKQSKITAKLNRPKTANVSLRQNNSSQQIVDLSNYEVVNTLTEAACVNVVKQSKQETFMNKTTTTTTINNNNMLINNFKKSVQILDDDQNYYEQYRLSPTTVNTQVWPYELEFDRYVKRRNLFNRIKTVKLVPCKKLPLVKIELMQQQQQQQSNNNNELQQQQQQTTTTNESINKPSNLKTNRPLTGIRTSATISATTTTTDNKSPNTILNNSSEYRRSLSAKQQLTTRSLIKLALDSNSKQSIESFNINNNSNKNEQQTEDLDETNVYLDDDTLRSNDKKILKLRSIANTLNNKKIVTIDETNNNNNNNRKQNNELKIPICTCHIITNNNHRPQAILQPLTVSLLQQQQQQQQQRRPNNLTKMNIDHMQFKKLAMQHQEEIYSLLDTTTTITQTPNTTTNAVAQISSRHLNRNYQFSDLYVPSTSHVKLNSIELSSKSANKQQQQINDTLTTSKSLNSNSVKFKTNNNNITENEAAYKQTGNLLLKANNSTRRPKTAKV